MQHHSPFEIKEKLLRALDEDNNVVDMAAVVEVISILEKTPITKDVLEKTRLGKYVNELRKKTSNEQLARRAKDLIKNWKKLLSQVEPVLNGERDGGPTCTPPIGVTSGPGPGGGGGGECVGARTSRAVRSEQNTTSPHCSSSSNSPLSLSSCSRTLPGHASATYAPPAKGVGPFHGVGSNGNCVNQVFKPVSPAPVHHNASRPATPGSAPQPARPTPHSPVVGNGSKQRSPCLNVAKKLHAGKRPTSAFSEFPSSPPAARGAHSNLEVAKTNAANKRLRKEPPPEGAPKKPPCVPPCSSSALPRWVNGAEASPPRSLPKVKTTQQLVADLQAKSALSPDVAKAAFYPLGCDADTSKTKSELMSRFLESASSSHAGPSRNESLRKDPVATEIDAILTRLPPIDYDAVDLGDEGEDLPPPPKEVTREDVERVCTQRWEMVNGNSDHENNWREWHETATWVSYEGNLLHVLPYVNIDW